MPQDDTYVTPTTPTPTTPVQDDATAQTWATPAPADTTPVDVLPIDVPASSPATPAPVDATPVNPVPVDPITSSPAYVAPTPTPVDDQALAGQVPVTDQAPAAGLAMAPIPDAANFLPAIPPASSEIYTAVAVKINDSKNVLIALSSDPSVDELSAAIGLSLYLDRIGKRATAIYSGATPNALEFLKPEETFETSADTLQDFVIALNKEKADHLRYKLDGDYVKVYITPYRHRLSQEDLEFSYGDYNVDLVIALDVANGIDLDAALREHGRIMHDAVIVNATTGNPGKFGEIEWSDKSASSVSEMVATLLYNFGGEDPVAKDEATAYLTGIVAATNRFANAKTTPATMRLCSKLMESGANQQLVSKNITPDVDNELIGFAAMSRNALANEAPKEEDPTKLEIEHDDDAKGKQSSDGASAKSGEISTEVTKKEHTLLDDLKAAEQSLAQASAETVPDDNGAALEIDSHSSSDGVPEIVADKSSSGTSSTDSTSSDKKPSDTKSSSDDTSLPELPTVDVSVSEEPTTSDTPDSGANVPDTLSEAKTSDSNATEQPEATPTLSNGFNTGAAEEDSAKYGQMLQDALDSINDTPAEPATAIMSQPDPDDNPAATSAPTVPANPEINGVPEMNFMPMPGTEILPPPPAPPISMPQDSTSQEPTLPVAGAPTTPLGPQPAMQDQVYRPQASDPGAFKIPGM